MFRFRKLYHKPAPREHVYNEVQKISVVNGSRVVTRVREDCVVQNNKIPKLKDYVLSDLLATDNLKPVSSNILEPDVNPLVLNDIDDKISKSLETKKDK